MIRNMMFQVKNKKQKNVDFSNKTNLCRCFKGWLSCTSTDTFTETWSRKTFFAWSVSLIHKQFMMVNLIYVVLFWQKAIQCQSVSGSVRPVFNICLQHLSSTSVSSGSGPCEDRRLWSCSWDSFSSSLHRLCLHPLVSGAWGSAEKVFLVWIFSSFHFHFLAIGDLRPAFLCNEKQYQARQVLHLVLSFQ